MLAAPVKVSHQRCFKKFAAEYVAQLSGSDKSYGHRFVVNFIPNPLRSPITFAKVEIDSSVISLLSSGQHMFYTQGNASFAGVKDLPQHHSDYKHFWYCTLEGT